MAALAAAGGTAMAVVAIGAGAGLAVGFIINEIFERRNKRRNNRQNNPANIRQNNLANRRQNNPVNRRASLHRVWLVPSRRGPQCTIHICRRIIHPDGRVTEQTNEVVCDTDDRVIEVMNDLRFQWGNNFEIEGLPPRLALTN